jgi:hypothetical protein
MSHTLYYIVISLCNAFKINQNLHEFVFPFYLFLSGDAIDKGTEKVQIGVSKFKAIQMDHPSIRSLYMSSMCLKENGVAFRIKVFIGLVCYIFMNSWDM